MLNHRARLLVLAALGLALALALGGPAHAGYIVNVTQSGGDVIAVGSGTLDLKDLTNFSGTDHFSAIYPNNGIAYFGGSVTPNSTFAIQYNNQISGPANFGPGNATPASSASGVFVGILSNAALLVERDYVSGSLIDSTSTWSNATFASLSLTSGTYTWTWGSGADADSFTMNIGGSSPVPEPASLVMLGTGVAVILGQARRRKVKASSNAA